MNLKNFAIILAFISLELKVFSSPIKDILSQDELTAVEISDSEISTEEIVTIRIDENSILEDDDNSDSEWEASEVNNNGEDIYNLPCNDINDCIDWLGANLDIANLFINPKLSTEDIQYMREHYKDTEILQQKYDAINYGKKVEVNGLQMSVNIMGEENEKTIVLLPGLGITCPVIFYKNITESLSTDFRVVTIEPFGYGLSDLTKKERTVQNIVGEIHECLDKLGIKQFYLMGHSIGGIYAFAYDNTYKGEMLGFIGIDNTSNFEIPVSMDYPEIFFTVISIFDKYHMYKILPEEVKNQLIPLDMELQYQNYTEQEIEILNTIYLYKSNNKNIMKEYELMSVNIAATKDLYFQCPALMFIASDTIESSKSMNIDLEQLYMDMIVDNPNSEVITLEGVHRYLHSQNKEVMVKKIKEWIN